MVHDKARISGSYYCYDTPDTRKQRTSYTQCHVLHGTNKVQQLENSWDYMFCMDLECDHAASYLWEDLEASTWIRSSLDRIALAR